MGLRKELAKYDFLERLILTIEIQDTLYYAVQYWYSVLAVFSKLNESNRLAGHVRHSKIIGSSW